MLKNRGIPAEDLNPQETSEWMQAFEQILEDAGPDRASFLLGRLTHQAAAADNDALQASLFPEGARQITAFQLHIKQTQPGQARLREAFKLGFKTAIVPKAIRKGEGYPKEIEIIEVRSIQQALDAAFAVREMPKGRHMAEA